MTAVAERPRAQALVVVGMLGATLTAAVAAVMVALTGSLLPAIAAGAGAFGVILVRRPDIGTLVFLGMLWLNVPGVLARFHGVPDLVAQVVVLLAIVPAAFYILRGHPIVVTPATFAVLLFLAANLLSAAASSNVTLAAESVIDLILEGVLIYLIVSQTIRTPRMATAIVWVLVAAGVVMGALAVHQELTGAYRETYFGFSLTNRIEDPLISAVQDDGRPRMMGPIGEQNRFAQVLIVLVPLALLAMNISYRFWRWVVPAGATLIILAGLILTFSRGAAVAIILLLLIAALWRYVRLAHLAAIIAAGVLSIAIVTPDLFARVESIGAVTDLVAGEEQAPDGAILGRATSNLAALLVFADYPLIGVGPGVYAVDYSVPYANELGLRYFSETRRAHNMYLEWAADLGVLGLVTGVAMLALSVIHLQRLRSYWATRRREYANLAGAFSLALVAYAWTAVFLHLSYLRYFFALLAMANAVAWMLEANRLNEQGALIDDPKGTERRSGVQPVGEAEVLPGPHR